ncbi:MAG: hypothetical protein LBP92_02135 [Deltaproteobacteria bacterium]|nr:hypothetical protein [Deltaproteobacteria bacterium]
MVVVGHFHWETGETIAAGKFLNWPTVSPLSLSISLMMALEPDSIQ